MNKMNNMGKMNKNGQEEIVGFVLIVVIIAVLMVVFLVLFIKNGSNNRIGNSLEVKQFLESSMEYTSECAINYQPDYSRISDLLRDCNGGKTCLSGKESCQVLNETLYELINSSWKFGDDRAIKGFMLNATYYLNSSTGITNRAVLYMAMGNCSGAYIGGESRTADYPGDIIIRMILCS